MPHAPRSRILSISERVYRALLHVYPAVHRREYGPLMLQAFHDLCRDAHRQRGRPGLFRLWGHVLLDAVATAAAEHVYEFKRREKMTRRQHVIILVRSGLPLGLGVILLLVNPRFMSLLVAPPPSGALPMGWIITAAIFALIAIAYVTQRKIAALSSDAASSAWTARPTFRSALFVGSVVLLTFPAILLTLLGPAIVQVYLFLLNGTLSF